MEFTVSKADLVRELESVPRRRREEDDDTDTFECTHWRLASDRITLTATDLELGIRCSCPAKVKKGGSGTIPAKKLLDYVRLLPEAEVQIKFLENHWASLLCGRSRTRIAGMSRESFPELPAHAGRDGRDSAAVLCVDDRQDDFCDLGRGVALHAQRRAAGAQD